MSTEGFVLSAFFAGYMLTQALGGHLADRYGGTRVLLAGVAIWTLATVCTPIAARAGLVPLLATRVIMG